MKKLLLLFAFLFSITSNSQNENIISQQEFENIEINNVQFIDLMNTHGNETKVVQLFGTPISKDLDKDGDFFNYKYHNLEFGFSALLSSDYNKPILSRLELINSNATIKIKQVQFKIGDNISKLGNVRFKSSKNGNKIIIFSPCNGCNHYFSIRYNQTTENITEIVYIEMT